MTISSALYSLLVKPLELLFEVIFSYVYRVLENPGLTIVFLSLAVNFLVLPLYRRADAMQAEVVRRFLLQECGGIRDITRAHFVSAVDLLSAEVGKRIDLPGGIKLKADYDELIVEKIADEEVPQDPWSIDIPKLEVGESYEISLDEYDIHMEVVQWTAEEEIPDKT